MVAKIRGVPVNLLNDYNEITAKINQPYDLYIFKREQVRLEYKNFTICILPDNRYAFKYDTATDRQHLYPKYKSELYFLAKVT